MESFEFKNSQENKDILDPNQMYFDFIEKQDKSTWDHEESLGYLVPDFAVAEFIQEYLQKNNFRHLDIYKYCEKNRGNFADVLLSYYRDLIKEHEIPDVIRQAFQIQPDDISAIFQDIILLDKKREKETRQIEKRNKLREQGTFFINELEVTPKEKLVKFPEYLIEETGGVEGYLRRELTWDNLDQLYSNLISKEELKKWIDIYWKISDYEIYSESHEEEYRSFEKVDSLESFKVLCSILKDLNGFFVKRHYMGEKLPDLKDHLNPEEFKRFEKIIPRVSNIFRAILDVFGDNFISRENIHVMHLYGSHEKELTDDFSSKMITQKIFDPEVDLFRSGINYEVYSTPNLEIVPSDESEPAKRIVKGKTFLITGAGLSVSNAGIWAADSRDDSRLSPLHTVFGFSRQNKAYFKYLKNCLELYEKLFKKTQKIEYRYLHDRFKNYYFCLQGLVSSGQSDQFSFGGDTPHPKIPVVIGHPNIPDLRWCHSNHAYTPTKNGINVLKMISSKEEMIKEENRLKNKTEIRKEE